MSFYNSTLYPGIEQYAIFAEFTDGHKESASGLYKVKANALKEAARRNAGAKADYERYKDENPDWAEEVLKRRYYVVKIKYEEVTE